MKARPNISSLTSLVALAVLTPSLALAKPQRPDPLARQADCESFHGTAVGANDSTQLFELRVCPGSEGVSATLQSSSLVSGFSVRASEGSWDAAGRTLRLVETRFIENRPEPDWRFCLIDEMVLTRTDTGLVGTYASAACDDRADLTFEKLPDEGGAATPSSPAVRPPAEQPPSPSPAPETRTSEAPPRSGCACTSDGQQDGSAGATLALLLLALSLSLPWGRRRP